MYITSTCTHCEKQFTTKGSLNRHLLRTHNISPPNHTRLFRCLEQCTHKFKNVESLREHQKRCHKQERSCEELGIEIAKEKNCDELCCTKKCTYELRNLQQLRDHLEDIHGEEEHCSENLEFSNKKDFDEWKSRLEDETNNMWILQSSFKTLKCGSKSQTYFCCRSGKKRLRGSGKRQMKSQGSRKMDGYCTSAIRVTYTANSSIKVQYFSKHYGHDQVLGHITLPKRTRQEIAEKLAQGIPPKRVVADFRVSLDNKLRRKHLVSIKDVRNIKAEFRISDSIRNRESAALSMDSSWIQGLESNSVLIYKRPGEKGEPGMDERDFMLVIMTSFQRRLLDLYGHDRICLESNRRTHYGVALTSMIAVNKFEEGVPIAFCLSSSVNTSILKRFFHSIHKETGGVNCNVLVIDEGIELYDAWEHVMGAPNHCFMSAQCIDEAWKTNLCLITDDAKRKNVYNALKACQLQLDEEEFHKMISNLQELLEGDGNTNYFYQYLKTYYTNRIELWAYCYRTDLYINTNVNVETFHRIIKQTKRIDKCIPLLEEYFIDEGLNDLTKLQKGRIATKKSIMQTRHEEAISIVERVTAYGNEVCWLFESCDVEPQHMINKVVDHECDSQCLIKCDQCLVCLKGMICSCDDNMLKGNSCKHIHAVALYNMNFPPEEMQSDVQDEGCDVNDDSNSHDETIYVLVPSETLDNNSELAALINEEASVDQEISSVANQVQELLASKRGNLAPDVSNDILEHLRLILELLNPPAQDSECT